MFKFTWHSMDILTNEDAEHMRQLFYNTTPYVAGFDTEATGLNPVRDKPFLIQFGWIDTTTMQGYTFTVDIEQRPNLAEQVIKVWHALVRNLKKYVGHHIVFDMHMMTNIGLPYTGENITDTMAYIRLGTDAIQTDKGGAPLGLKDFSARYIDASAKVREQKLTDEKKSMTMTYNNQLKAKLHWTKKKIDTFFKDKLNEYTDLPEELQGAYIEWHSSLPLYLQQKVTGAVESDMIRYDYLNRKNVTDYGHYDVIYTLETFYLLEDSVHVRGNDDTLAIEERNLYVVYDMERVGFKADRTYLYESKERVKKYILQRREDMRNIAGKTIAVGQHAKVLEVLNSLGVSDLESTGKELLERKVSELKHTGECPTALEFIEILQELRTLEKWYSVYICRFLYDLQFGDYLYTGINPFGAVSGRVSSDFQQFPKKAIKTVDGEELFHPRKFILVSDGFKGTVYLDYSQVELRLQALYTILVGHPDTNLCRAYMPYKCHTFLFGREMKFDYTQAWCIEQAYNLVWYYDEEPNKEWHPLDVHGATTKAAFDIDEDDENFHDMRYVGKRVNFAKNYGAQRGKIREMFPEFDEEQITKINDAYYIAFPGVKEYHEYCYNLVRIQPCATNLFGRKYWGVSGHNLINMLVQGSGADLLKIQKYKAWRYLKDRGFKSKLQMEIHDELSFQWHPDDPPHIFFEIQKILQTWEDTLVPIVSDMEITYTNWAEKKEVNNIVQL